MSHKKNLRIGCCTGCGAESTSVKENRNRKVLHFRVGGMETLSFPSIVFRCLNKDCAKKTFTYVLPTEGSEEVVGNSRYSKSSKNFVANKMLKKQTSYQSFCQEIKEDFGAKTAFSTIHRWTQATKTEEVPLPTEPVTVLHTDEKHPSKKKENQINNL